MTGAIYRPANPAYRTPAYRKGRTRLLATDPTCVHCGRPATEADHQPPLALHRHVDGTDCCRLVASCASCGRRQGNAVLGGLRAGAVLPSQASAPPPAAVEPVGWSSDDPIWDKSWLEGLRDVPTDATWPRLMTPPHPAAVDSYGAELAAYAEARSGKPLRWWQRLAAARLLEHDIHGELVWPAVDVTVARQVGKSWLLRELCLWRIHQGDRFGEPQTVVHTGKDLNICVEIQRPARRWARGERFADVYKVRDANGTEQIELLADGSRWMVRAKEGVYGLSASLAVVDEGWAVPATMIEEGLVPTMVELTSSQLLLVSTAHRKATALMLARRAVALADLGATDRDLWMEWSASPVVDVADPAGWRAASPQWSPKRHRLIGQRLAAAQSGEATDDPDEPNPLEAFVAQWLNRWPARCRHAGKGEPLVPDDAWAACRGALSGAAGPGIVALEENRGEGAAAAFVATDGAGRFEVDGRACPSWSEAIDLARFFVNARPGSRIYVGARMNNQLPDDFPDRHLARKAGVTETGRGLSLLRALVAESRVVHDDTADIDDQIARARVHNLTGGGLGLVNNNARGDLFRAALWALDAAQEAAPNRGFTDIYDLTSWPAPADSARGRPPGDDTDVISGVGGSGRMMSRPPSTGRFARALIPREVPDPAPRDRLPNDNPPVGTTGPNVPEGFGDTHVMYPAVNPPFQAEAWAGWPVDWATPYLETSPTWSTFFGYGADDPAGFLKRVSTVGTCVDKNSRQLASFPVYAVRDRHPVPLPSWYTRSPEPELYADWVEFMKAAVNSYQLRGETLLWATSRFADGFPARFIVLEPNNIEITDQGDYFLIRDNGERVQISRADVCHVKYQRARA